MRITQRKAEDIPVERMNYEFLDGFNLFLQPAHRCHHNGVVAVMDCLRNEWITKNPFRYYKLKEDEVQVARDRRKNGILVKIGLPLLRLSTDGSSEKERIVGALEQAMQQG